MSRPDKHIERQKEYKRIKYESLMGIRSTMLVMTDSGLKRVSKFFIRANDSKFGTRIEKARRKPRNPKAVIVK
tara:strand:+ start:279 stop:497 length:219 start_codon:yes stop_codon:yes gene_type:complete